MVTPTGSQPHSTRREIDGGTATGVLVDLGDTTLTLYSREREELATIPRPLARYTRGSGMLYRIMWEGRSQSISAKAIDSGDVWADKLGLHFPKKLREIIAGTFLRIGADLPEAAISPGITEGIPPRAPATGPRDGSPAATAAAKAALAELGRDRAAPLGRWLIGLAAVSPWIDLTGMKSIMVHLPGQTGDGKTAIAHAAAGLFGALESKRGPSLLQPANGTMSAYLAAVQRRSYLPFMLDEMENLTGDPQAGLVGIIQEGQRARADREGEEVENPGRWHGLVLTTGNEKMRPQLTAEMWNRRLIELENTGALWAARPFELNELRAWWVKTYELLEQIEGHPYAALVEQFGIGTPAARDFLARVDALPIPPGHPKQMDISLAARLGVVGCQWLAEWTGEPAWIEDAWDTACAIVGEQFAACPDPARDTAEAIIQHRVREPRAWTMDAAAGTGRVAYPSTYGACSADHKERCDQQTKTEWGEQCAGIACGIMHPGKCEWWDMPSTAVEAFFTASAKRLSRTLFRVVLAPGDTDRLTWKPTLRDERGEKAGRVRAYTMCLPGLEWLANPAEDATLPALQLAAPQLAADVAPHTPPSSAAVVEVDQAEELEEIQDALPVWSWTDDPDMVAAVELAATKGVTDLTGPFVPGWIDVDQLDAAGWDRHGWQGHGDARGTLTRGDTRITIGRHHDPEAYAAALEDYAELTGRRLGVSEGSEAARMLREIGREQTERDQADTTGRRSSRPARFLLPGEFADQWNTEGIALPRGWTAESGKPETAASWDRIKSHLPAITQARIAPLYPGQTYAEVEGRDVPAFTGKASDPAGMFLIAVPLWPWPELPAPLGTIEPGRDVWVSAEIMRLYAARDVAVHVHRAHIAPAAKPVALVEWDRRVRHWLDQPRPATMIVKGLYQKLAGRFQYDPRQYDRQPGHHDVFRPDWGAAIDNNSWCMVLRRVYAAADEGWIPSAVATDAVYYDRPGTPPGFPVATKAAEESPGKFRLERPYSGPELGGQ